MRLSKSILGLVLLPIGLASCEPKAEAAPPPPEPMSQAGANAIRDAYAMSFMGKNAAGVAAFYAESATHVAPDGTVVTGRAAIQEALTQQFAAGYDSLAIMSSGFNAAGDEATDQGTYKVRRLDPKTKEATRFTGSYKVTFGRQPDGGFQIVKDSIFGETEIK